MKDYLKRPEFMCEAKEMSKGRNLFVEILLFVAVAFVTTFAVSVLTLLVIAIVVLVKIYAPSVLHLNMVAPSKDQLIQSFSAGSDSSTIIMLFSEIAMIAVVFLFCRWIEKRKLRTLGFLKKRVVIEYAKGLLVGFVIFSVAVLLCVATGTLKITGFSIGFSVVTVLLYFFGYMIQGMAEEVLCRGYFMVSLARRYSIPVAVFVSSFAFSLLHMGNPGITVLAVASTVALAACGAGGNKSAKDDKTLTVGIMTLDNTTEPVWDKVKELAKDKGVTIDLKEFTDFNQPNKALKNGEIDVNAFQHIYFLNNWNKENKGDLVPVADTLLSPIHLFSGTENGKAKYKDVKELPEGATISVPNDSTNESRALTLLQTAGLLKLDVKDGELATIKNISENPKKLEIKEISAEQAAQTLSSVDAAVVNNTYAQQQNVDYNTTLFQEDPSQDLKEWVNIIAANKDWEKSNKSDAIKTLIKAYQNDEVAQIIYDASNKVDLPAWKGAPTRDQLEANSKK